MSEGGPGLAVGDEVEVEVGAVAHGGHCVARHEGQVLFVRHALPGERVTARVTERGPKGRFLRADAVAVREASPDRVTPPCPWAGPGLCGGCDLQHVALGRQRTLKADVVREQLSRLAGLDLDVVVESVPGADDGLGWRSRVEYAVDHEGRAGLRRHRSHDLVLVDHCRIAAPGVRGLDVPGRSWFTTEAVDAVAPSAGEPVAVAVPDDPVPDVHERVEASWATGAGETRSFRREFAVSARGFWQVHPGAPATFLAAVMGPLAVHPGERALDLYSGVGLFAAALGEAVGPDGQVVAVESDGDAVERARTGLAALSWVLPVRARVDEAFGVPRPTRGPRRGGRPRRPTRSPLLPTSADVVVLDPPRTGAGEGVVRAVAALGPRAVAHVACDPAALARDTAALLAAGYRLDSLRAFDAFPMTHHVECVAHFVPDAP
ncbi:class I SAM-dependent RNA methyltransferase [Phycicoccus flavus]|uniref:class I SAM-dependent RNA methyltransferase n=1 Tax=Phycicoccus flavus TaxID=2502783 RepID=UPI000FEB9883|nr:TRAM domain-containing protein [Phycicoccus flavus]NHA69620.1 class I SAM-dependent RNA methyltransferase [Phycicoccus flavus]